MHEKAPIGVLSFCFQGEKLQKNPILLENFREVGYNKRV